jgi:hypothetical protein
MEFLRRDPTSALMLLNGGFFVLLTTLGEAWKEYPILTAVGSVTLALVATLLFPGDVLLGADGFIVRTSSRLAETWANL